MDYYTAIVFIGSVFVMRALESCMQVFFDKQRTSPRVKTISYWVYPFAITVMWALYRTPIASSVTTFFSIFIMSLNYESPWIKRFVAVISIVVIAAIFYNAISLALEMYLRSAFYTVYSAYYAHFLIEVVLFPALLLTVALLLQNFKNIKNNVITLPGFWVSVFAIPLLSFIVLFIIVSAADMSPVAQIAALCMLVGINILVFYLNDRMAAAHEARLETVLAAQEKDYYMVQCRLMQESAGRVSSSRHDMKIHMAALKSFIAENRTGSAVDYIDTFLGGVGESTLLSETGNLAFDSIINYKLKDIKNSDIKLNLRLKIPPVLDIADADIVTIIGNLLDNALEAVAKVDEKTIKLNAVLDNSALLIKAENSFNGEVKEGMASLKDGSEHGHGLKNIKRSVDKYGGYMKTTHTGTVFSVSILLYGKNGD